ncbi:AI-2E family transporter [Stratiformator vulcanicus]|uniref:AI-2 transport protein TqsA n=1 Tax=Stratiformator vulcanicus TaxID=2527980 RepID=A0A517QY97_9PLAN|nr:AI-2E family transporter [Stratiformator vulcanicus]QDT36568.1 AI-2 transport protein TqsA [Stratiformator vulcanicus]
MAETDQNLTSDATAPDPELRVQTICLLVMTAALVGGLVYLLRPVLLPLVVAVFVVSGVTPVLKFIEKTLGAGRWTAVVITVLGGLVGMTLLSWLLWLSIGELQAYQTQYRERVQGLITWAEGLADFEWSIFDDRTSTDTDKNADSPVEAIRPEEDAAAAAARHEAASREARKALDLMVQRGASVVTGTLLDMFSVGIIVLIYVFFLLIGAPTLPEQRTPMMREMDLLIRNYLALKTVISLFTGLAFGGVLWIFGVPMAVAFGMLAFLLNYIPNLGPLIAIVLPIPLILLHPDGTIIWMTMVITLAALVQFVSGNVIEPKIMGESADLHPIVILSALMLWGTIWGLMGMFLATPITAGIKIALARNRRTRSVADFMAGRWDAFDKSSESSESATSLVSAD